MRRECCTTAPHRAVRGLAPARSAADSAPRRHRDDASSVVGHPPIVHDRRADRIDAVREPAVERLDGSTGAAVVAVVRVLVRRSLAALGWRARARRPDAGIDASARCLMARCAVAGRPSRPARPSPVRGVRGPRRRGVHRGRDHDQHRDRSACAERPRHAHARADAARRDGDGAGDLAVASRRCARFVADARSTYAGSSFVTCGVVAAEHLRRSRRAGRRPHPVGGRCRDRHRHRRRRGRRFVPRTRCRGADRQRLRVGSDARGGTQRASRDRRRPACGRGVPARAALRRRCAERVLHRAAGTRTARCRHRGSDDGVVGQARRQRRPTGVPTTCCSARRGARGRGRSDGECRAHVSASVRHRCAATRCGDRAVGRHSRRAGRRAHRSWFDHHRALLDGCGWRRLVRHFGRSVHLAGVEQRRTRRVVRRVGGRGRVLDVGDARPGLHGTRRVGFGRVDHEPASDRSPQRDHAGLVVGGRCCGQPGRRDRCG